MSEMGKCESCGAAAIVVVNDRRGCPDHIEDAIAAAFKPLRAVLGR